MPYRNRTTLLILILILIVTMLGGLLLAFLSGEENDMIVQTLPLVAAKPSIPAIDANTPTQVKTATFAMG
ncbi:MAG: hypothetical protein JXA37_13500 [Chloroflexia bacterium]|nr:hypothetical protein [Chloroflexia bacterium]